MMQIVKQSFLVLVLGISAFFMPHAKASCTSPDMPKMIDVASISVPTSLAVGATIPGSEQTVHVAGNCSSTYSPGMEIVACYYGSGSEIPGLPGVYDSGVAGIGIALMNDQGQRIQGAGGVHCDSRNTPVGYLSSDGQLSFNFDVTLELVKTSSTVSSGSLSQAQTEFGLGVYNQEGIGSPNTISYSGNVTFNEVTCSVSPKSLTVTLGDFPVSDFTGAGTLTSPQAFDVTVNCNDTVQPEVMVSSANGYETDFPGVIKLTQESGVATGVGVRMMFDGEIANFDIYKNTAAIAQANIPLTIPFEVAYQQTAASVTPGTANSIATITLGYK